jgi:hypothetical protein
MLMLPFDYFAADYQASVTNYAVHEGVGTGNYKS